MASDIAIFTKNQSVIINGTAMKEVNGVQSVLDLTTEVTQAPDLIITRPNGTVVQTTATSIVDGSAGTFTLELTSEVFAGYKGNWKFQAKYTLLNSRPVYSNTVEEYIDMSLDDTLLT